MALKRKKDGNYAALSSQSDVRAALDRLADIDNEIKKAAQPLMDEKDALKAAVDTFVIEHYAAGEGYEDDTWRATKVVGHTRSWDVEKLEKLLPRGIFKNVTKIAVDAAKVDQFVKEKKIDVKVIAPAFTEKPNRPYTKITKLTVQRGEDQADSLAAKLA